MTQHDDSSSSDGAVRYASHSARAGRRFESVPVVARDEVRVRAQFRRDRVEQVLLEDADGVAEETGGRHFFARPSGGGRLDELHLFRITHE